jgi:hypothetical protein
MQAKSSFLFTPALHLSLFWARIIQYHTMYQRSVLILSFHLRLNITSGSIPYSPAGSMPPLFRQTSCTPAKSNLFHFINLL